MQYRSDIDGLRCIAVSSVVLFHAGATALSGGFVGVDVFFVISGFLISGGLFAEGEQAAAGKGISIVRFYDRRARRILPAYAALMIAALAAGVLLLLPSELAALAKSIVAATLFAANIHFWSGAGYFAGAPLAQPMLHMWSLAVEEQFYLVWPVLVLLLYRFRLQHWRVPIILAGIAVTLAASEWMIGYSSKTAFYMAPLRAWELLLGALLACVRWPRLGAAWQAHAIGGLATALLLVPMLTYTEATRFPGLSAVPPCLGAALVIYRDPRHTSFLARILATPVPVFIGKISYSLYIWHWPILAFVWIERGALPTGAGLIVLLAAIVSVATLSWWLVEQPFRAHRDTRTLSRLRAGIARASSRSVLMAAAGMIAVPGAAAGAVVLLGGLPQRLPAQARIVDTQARAPFVVSRGCVFAERVPHDAATRCFAAADAGPPGKTVLWGDSFAGQHIAAIQRRFASAANPLLSIVVTGCSPFPGVTQYFGYGRDDARCTAMSSAVLGRLAQRNDVGTVVLAARWSNLYGLPSPGPGFDPNARFLDDTGSNRRTLDHSLATMERSLDRTITMLEQRGMQVIVLQEPPRYPHDVQPCVARQLWHGNSAASCAASLADEQRFHAPTARVFARLAERHPRLLVFDPTANLCHNGVCSGYRDGTLVTQDSEHLTPEGSEIALRGLGGRP